MASRRPVFLRDLSERIIFGAVTRQAANWGTGTFSSLTQWLPALGRHGRLLTIAGTGGAGRLSYERFLQTSALPDELQPKWGPLDYQFVFRNQMRAARTAGVGNVRAFMGFGAAFTAQEAFDDGHVGFQAAMVGGVLTWHAVAKTNASVEVLALDLGLDAATPHNFDVVLDLYEHKILYLVDGAEVASYAVQDGDIFQITNQEVGGIVGGFAPNGSTVEVQHAGLGDVWIELREGVHTVPGVQREHVALVGVGRGGIVGSIADSDTAANNEPGSLIGTTVAEGYFVQRGIRSSSTAGLSGQSHGLWPVHLLLDPTVPYEDMVLHTKALLRVVHSSGNRQAAYGFFDYLDVAVAASLVGIGFYEVDGGNWVAFVRTSADDVNVTVVVDQPLGITSNTFRRLAIEIDGDTHEVRWFIDGVQVHSWLSPGPLAKTGANPRVRWNMQSPAAAGNAELQYAPGWGEVPVLSMVLDPAGSTIPDQPAQPTLTVTELGATFAKLSGSAFSSPRAGAEHLFSRWQVDEAGGDFSTPVYDSGFVGTFRLLTDTAAPLVASTDYIARVQYMDELLVASPVSATVPFTTLAADPATAWTQCDA